MQKIAPKHPQTLYLQALLAFQKKDYVAARDAIQRQLAARPDNVAGLVLAGRIENQLGSYAQAESSLAKALQRAPGQSVARVALIDTYLRTGQVGQGARHVEAIAGSERADVGHARARRRGVCKKR